MSRPRTSAERVRGALLSLQMARELSLRESAKERLALRFAWPFWGTFGTTMLGYVFGSILLVFVTSMAMIPRSQDPLPTQALLQDSWKAVHAQMILNNRQTFPNRQQVVRSLEAGEPGALVEPRYDYLDLRGHHRPNGVIAIEHVDPAHLALVARKGGDAIVEMEVAAGSTPSFHTLYHGKAHMLRWLRFVGEAEGVLFALLFLLALALDQKDYRRRRGAVLSKRAQDRERLARWQELVPDSRFGPSEPDYGFRLFRPIKRDQGGVCRLYAEPVVWQGDTWRVWEKSTEMPETLREVQVPIDEQSVVRASEKWVELCQAVAAENAARYASRRLAEEAKQKALAAKQALAAGDKSASGAKSVEEGQPAVAELLPAAGDLLKSLPLPDGR